MRTQWQAEKEAWEARWNELQQELLRGPLAKEAQEKFGSQSSQAPFSPPSSHCASAPHAQEPGGSSDPVSSVH